MDPSIIPWAVSAAVSAGAAFAGVKVGLNGQKERLVRVEDRLERVDQAVGRISTQVARLEGHQLGQGQQ